MEQEFDPPPMAYRGRTMLPFRAIGEALGMTVRHNRATNSVYLTADGVEAVHVPRTYVITVNGEDFTFDAPSIIVENRILMPLRMFEPMGVNVRWDSAARTVRVTQPPAPEVEYEPENEYEDEYEEYEEYEEEEEEEEPETAVSANRLPAPTNARFTFGATANFHMDAIVLQWDYPGRQPGQMDLAFAIQLFDSEGNFVHRNYRRIDNRRLDTPNLIHLLGHATQSGEHTIRITARHDSYDRHSLPAELTVYITVEEPLHEVVASATENGVTVFNFVPDEKHFAFVYGANGRLFRYFSTRGSMQHLHGSESFTSGDEAVVQMFRIESSAADTLNITITARQNPRIVIQ